MSGFLTNVEGSRRDGFGTRSDAEKPYRVESQAISSPGYTLHLSVILNSALFSLSSKAQLRLLQNRLMICRYIQELVI